MLNASPRTATRSGARAAALIAAAMLLSVATAKSAAAQVVIVPDTVRADTVRADTIVARADTTREVTHTVKKGDTLWDLANFYLKDPFRWPEIFRRNTDVVENPHWIYPGEIIRIWGSEVRPEALAKADSAGEVVSHVVTRPAPPPVSTAAESELTVFASPLSRAAALVGSQVIGRSRAPGVRPGEVEAAPYVDRSGGPRGAGQIIASLDRPGISTPQLGSRYLINDRLFIRPPNGETPRLGDRYLAYALGPDLADGGQVVIPTGILRVEALTPGQPATVRITRQFGEIKLEQHLIPFAELSVPTSAASPVAGGTSGTVLFILNDPVLPSIGHYVVISPNAGDGVQVGDEFTFIDQSVGRADGTPAPPVAAGIAQVVRVTRYAATAIIVNQVQPTIREGMPVRMTGKMP